MITLGGIELDRNLYLGGVEQSKNTAVQQVRTVEGVSIVTTKATPGGRTLTLGTDTTLRPLQGIWCQTIITQIKDLQLANQEVELVYYGVAYNVKIIITTDFDQRIAHQLRGDGKEYTGTITLIEV